jgi:hypothetical protein
MTDAELQMQETLTYSPDWITLVVNFIRDNNERVKLIAKADRKQSGKQKKLSSRENPSRQSKKEKNRWRAFSLPCRISIITRFVFVSICCRTILSSYVATAELHSLTNNMLLTSCISFFLFLARSIIFVINLLTNSTKYDNPSGSCSSKCASRRSSPHLQQLQRGQGRRLLGALAPFKYIGLL